MLSFATFVLLGYHVTPEPSSILILATGAIAMAFYAWRRFRA